ncbi:hypothetical protein A2U01_0068394, partial [Trifolium medium]|nr:hypothetical protein [Trifolium medium]
MRDASVARAQAR